MESVTARLTASDRLVIKASRSSACSVGHGSARNCVMIRSVSTGSCLIAWRVTSPTCGCGFLGELFASSFDFAVSCSSVASCYGLSIRSSQAN